jgi:molecular chaperone DnaK (HSP70)
LTAICNYVKSETLHRHFGEQFLQRQQVSYVITVPAIWSDKAKDRTRQAAYRAGILRRKLVLITEPEAAALYCATFCKEVDLEAGDRFLVCDAGGGTVVCLTLYLPLTNIGPYIIQSSHISTFFN